MFICMRTTFLKPIDNDKLVQYKHRSSYTCHLIAGSVLGPWLRIYDRGYDDCLRNDWVRKWKAMGRIPLLQETAAQRLKFACYWIPIIDDIMEVRGSKVKDLLGPNMSVQVIFSDKTSVQNLTHNTRYWLFRKPVVNLKVHGKPNYH